jgi:hypothetical protein
MLFYNIENYNKKKIRTKGGIKMNKRFFVFLIVVFFFSFSGFVCAQIPTLISPRSGAVLDNGCIDKSNEVKWYFDWSDVRGATKYHLYVKGATAQYPLINNANLTTSNYLHKTFGYIATHNLNNWKWKVQAYVNGRWRGWSRERSFNVEPLNTDCRSVPAPTLISPRSGAVLDNGCIDKSNEIKWYFDWSDIRGATKYHLYVKGATAQYPLINKSNLTTSNYLHKTFGYIATHNLNNWKWKVRAYVNGKWGAWSGERSFNVEPLNTDCRSNSTPTLISPRSGALLDNGCIDKSNEIKWYFDWSDVRGASKYHLYVKGATAQYPLINKSNLTTSNYLHKTFGYIATHNLNNWKWKVRAYVNGSWRAWSSERSFNVEPLNTDCK